MDNLLILKCDQEISLGKKAERIFNMKRIVSLPDDDDEEFKKQKESCRIELQEIQRQLF